MRGVHQAAELQIPLAVRKEKLDKWMGKGDLVIHLWK